MTVFVIYLRSRLRMMISSRTGVFATASAPCPMMVGPSSTSRPCRVRSPSLTASTAGSNTSSPSRRKTWRRPEVEGAAFQVDHCAWYPPPDPLENLNVPYFHATRLKAAKMTLPHRHQLMPCGPDTDKRVGVAFVLVWTKTETSQIFHLFQFILSRV